MYMYIHVLMYTLLYGCFLLFCVQVVLCFSPVGTTLRVRARKFPAIVNCTNIDWFHEWPEEALISVSSRFLSEVDLIKVSYIKCFLCIVYICIYTLVTAFNMFFL